MISHLSHITIFVEDQDTALDFYINKLGFTVDTDALLGTGRWLTVRAPEQKDRVTARALAGCARICELGGPQSESFFSRV